MELAENQKQKILSALQQSRENFTGSDAKFAMSLGIAAAQYNQVKQGKTSRVLSDAKWIAIARRLDVELTDAPEWKTACTPVFQFITAQLAKCQSEQLSSLLCDMSDIGKTYAAKDYAGRHSNVVYADCSQIKSKQKLIRFIAKSFGVGHTGKYADVYEDLVYYLKTLQNPLIILDEAGDLQYDAFLEIKALWNATDRICAYYMMGADGLKEKISRSINCKKVGYTELFSRFGKRYGKVIPEGKEDREKLLSATAAMIIKANAGESADIKKMLAQTIGDDGTPSLRRIYTEIKKHLNAI